MNTWEGWEAAAQHLLATKQWEACIDHADSVKEAEKRDKKYIRSIERIYTTLINQPGYQKDVRVIRKLAHMYYRECITSKHNLTLKYDKQYCEQQAVHYFSALLQQERQPHDIYAYAQLLYRNANNFLRTDSIAVKKRKKETAYALYEEVIQKIEAEPVDTYAALYSQACYALGRCGLELVSLYSVLLYEMMLVTDMPLTLVGNKEKHETRLQRIHSCLDTVRKLSHMPRQLQRLTDIPTHTIAHIKPEYVYYLLGKAFDNAWQFGLCKNKYAARQWAERYYTYACEIHYGRITRKESKKFASCLYIALINLYIRQKDKEKCIYIWKKYHLSQYIPVGYQRLTAIRWAIIDKQYEKAQAMITAYQKEKNWQEGFSAQRAAACCCILEALQGNSDSVYAKQYSAKQVKLVKKLAEQSRSI